MIHYVSISRNHRVKSEKREKLLLKLLFFANYFLFYSCFERLKDSQRIYFWELWRRANSIGGAFGQSGCVSCPLPLGRIISARCENLPTLHRSTGHVRNFWIFQVTSSYLSRRVFGVLRVIGQRSRKFPPVKNWHETFEISTQFDKKNADRSIRTHHPPWPSTKEITPY